MIFLFGSGCYGYSILIRNECMFCLCYSLFINFNQYWICLNCFFLYQKFNSSRASFSSHSFVSHLRANGNMLQFSQMKSSSLSASAFFVFFLEFNAKIFFIFPFLTNPPAFSVVTNGLTCIG